KSWATAVMSVMGRAAAVASGMAGTRRSSSISSRGKTRLAFVDGRGDEVRMRVPLNGHSERWVKRLNLVVPLPIRLPRRDVIDRFPGPDQARVVQRLHRTPVGPPVLFPAREHVAVQAAGVAGDRIALLDLDPAVRPQHERAAAVRIGARRKRLTFARV